MIKKWFFKQIQKQPDVQQQNRDAFMKLLNLKHMFIFLWAIRK